MIKAIFFDVDGTLFSHTYKGISDSTKYSLDKLKEKGIKRIVATGRHMVELEKLLLTDIVFDGYITVNGQLCLDQEKRVVFANPILGTEKERLIQLFSQKKLPLMFIEKDRMYINYLDESVRKAQTAISTPVPRQGKYTGSEIYQAVAYISSEQEEALRAQFPEYKITRWNDYAVDILPYGSSKVMGIKEFLSKYNINQAETMAFGDGENDIEMLKYAKIGIAMGNAGKAAKANADYITNDIDQDGIKRALEHYRLIGGDYGEKS